MIATVIQGKTYAEILSLLDDPWVELAEIRLDLCPLSDAEIEDLFAGSDTPLIATCRANWGGGADASEGAAPEGRATRGTEAGGPPRSGGGVSPKGELPKGQQPSAAGLSPAEAERRLTLAIQAGARFADLEIEAEAGWSKRFRDLCRECGVEIIRSWHDFAGTPSPDYLRQIQARCYRYGADIAKIVTTASCPADCETVLRLYSNSGTCPPVAGQVALSHDGKSLNDSEMLNYLSGCSQTGHAREPGRLIAFAMGPVGRETRLECLRRGAPFSYAGLESKPGPHDLGQYGYEEMHRLVYGDFRGFWRVGGDLAVPCSKSFAQRAIVCAALAEGRSRLRSYTPCADSEAALAVARALGATVRKDAPGASDPAGSATLVIDGIGVRDQNRPFLLHPPGKNEGGPSKSAEKAGAPSEAAAEPRRLIAFAMGPVGRETRLECLRLGAPFSYASCAPSAGPVANSAGPDPNSAGLDPNSAGPVAPASSSFGQYGYEEMHRLVYGDFRGFWRVGGDLAVPCSKSFAQRAIVCAALAEGRSRLRAYTPCADSEAALAVARALGATVRKDAPGASDPAGSATLVIDGIGVRDQNRPFLLHPPAKNEGGASKSPQNDAAPAVSPGAVSPGAVSPSALAAALAVSPGAVPPGARQEISVGESGLLARICIPLMAAISDRPVTIIGEKTLLHRPLKGVQNVMASFGVPIRSELVPITVAPPLIPGNAEVSGADGSQIISGLLTALPLCDKNSTLYISEPKSIPYMFITEDILRKFGVRLKSEMEGDERMIEDQDWSGCTQISFSIKGGQRYKAADITLESDWSAAANFLVAGAIFGKAELSGLNTDSLQADLAIADILVQAGAVVSELDASVCVSKAPLEGFEADLGNAPDLFPICSVLAAFCDGETVLHGVDRLHGKESDRAAAILEMLTAFGVTATIDGDDLYITGETLVSRLLNNHLLRGSGPEGIASERRATHGDHRIAMALKIASMGADSPVVLDDPDCVAKSFPEFWEQFDY